MGGMQITAENVGTLKISVRSEKEEVRVENRGFSRGKHRGER